MSAFIISDGTMHRVVDAIITRPSKSIAARLFPFDHRYGDRQQIGQMLLDLNWDAIRQRYCNAHGFFGEPQRYRWQSRASTPIEHCKALSCLRYQCAEGNVPQHTLYRALTALEDEIASELVARMDCASRSMWTTQAQRDNDGEIPLARDIVAKTGAWQTAPWDWPDPA